MLSLLASQDCKTDCTSLSLSLSQLEIGPIAFVLFSFLKASVLLQDELYLHQLSDTCLEAVRRLLGPRRALLWIRCPALHRDTTVDLGRK